MRWRRLLAFTLLVAACSPSTTPATTPATVATTAPTTTLAPTTTVDRLAEIEAIYQNLEERRLDALFRGDTQTYRALFANEAYMERSLVLFDAVEFFDDWQPVDVVISEVIHDSVDCIAVRTETDYSDIVVGGTSDLTVEVIQVVDGVWGLSFVGRGWTCDGPHPFDS